MGVVPLEDRRHNDHVMLDGPALARFDRRTGLGTLGKLRPGQFLAGAERKRHGPRFLETKDVAPSSSGGVDKLFVLGFERQVLLFDWGVCW
jgi:hypothetical protein